MNTEPQNRKLRLCKR